MYEIEDGVTPDALEYDPSIFNNVANPIDQHEYDVYVMRFTVAGIVTYTWKLQVAEFDGRGPGFRRQCHLPCVRLWLYCQDLLTHHRHRRRLPKRSRKSTTCCVDLPWYNSWYGVGYG